MTGALIQLVAYGAQDVFLSQNSRPFSNTTYFSIKYKRHTNYAIDGTVLNVVYSTCEVHMKHRTYRNFEIIFDDTKIGEEMYNSNDLLYLFSTNLYNLNEKSILVNNQDIVLQHKHKIEELIKTYKKKLNKNKKEEENEEKKWRRSRDDIQCWKPSYKMANSNARAIRRSQDKQLKHQMKNQMKRR